ncbi:Speckle-type POZ protein B-like protein [Aphelenchoides besseyi]|nr:Speckle-type POZ protein B-like protein [Aphelenchoides besseyi]
MQSLSTFDDPNVAIQRIEDFAEHCEQSVENDRWASELFEFEYPEVGEIQFGLLFTPKTTLNSSPSKLCMQIMDVSSQFSISMKCDAWIETIDKTRSATKSQKFTFDTNATFKSWSPFLLSDEMSEFLNSSTIFICCRLPYPVKSIGSISKNSTLYRWPITDFESRFNSAQFNTRWESDKFTVSGLDGVKFCLSFCPKGDRETSKNSCAFYLWVKDLAGRSKVSVAYDLWIENSKSRFHKIGMIYVFSTATGYGTSSYVNQEELCKFAQIGPFDICCNVRPIVEPVPSFKCASMHSEIASFFNDPYFSDVEIRVDNEVFKVNRAIISGSSPVFRAMFDKETEEQKSGVVKIKGFEAAMVEKMLIYIYKGEISNMKAIAAQLLPIADCYQVNSLVKKCTDSIVANLTVEKVLPILELAFEHDHLNDFQDRVFNFAHKNYGAIRELSSYEEFLTDRPKIAIKLISVFYTSG